MKFVIYHICCLFLQQMDELWRCASFLRHTGQSDLETGPSSLLGTCSPENCISPNSKLQSRMKSSNLTVYNKLPWPFTKPAAVRTPSQIFLKDPLTTAFDIDLFLWCQTLLAIPWRFRQSYSCFLLIVSKSDWSWWSNGLGVVPFVISCIDRTRLAKVNYSKRATLVIVETLACRRSLRATL